MKIRYENMSPAGEGLQQRVVVLNLTLCVTRSDLASRSNMINVAF